MCREQAPSFVFELLPRCDAKLANLMECSTCNLLRIFSLPCWPGPKREGRSQQRKADANLSKAKILGSLEKGRQRGVKKCDSSCAKGCDQHQEHQLRPLEYLACLQLRPLVRVSISALWNFCQKPSTQCCIQDRSHAYIHRTKFTLIRLFRHTPR